MLHDVDHTAAKCVGSRDRGVGQHIGPLCTTPVAGDMVPKFRAAPPQSSSHHRRIARGANKQGPANICAVVGAARVTEPYQPRVEVGLVPLRITHAHLVDAWRSRSLLRLLARPLRAASQFGDGFRRLAGARCPTPDRPDPWPSRGRCCASPYLLGPSPAPTGMAVGAGWRQHGLPALIARSARYCGRSRRDAAVGRSAGRQRLGNDSSPGPGRRHRPNGAARTGGHDALAAIASGAVSAFLGANFMLLPVGSAKRRRGLPSSRWSPIDRVALVAAVRPAGTGLTTPNAIHDSRCLRRGHGWLHGAPW